ncbi:MAG: hypothetical protein LDL31_01085 [Prosthecobacter sp.]|nr:hypothetical protein [Prosthecobacter sp.]
MAKIEKIPTAEFNPFYGCFIMSMAVLVFLGIIGWSAWSLISQDRAISVFAEDAPVVLPPISLSEAERKTLETKLATFAAEARAGGKASLSLSLAELNGLLLLAPDSGYGSYRDMVRFEKLNPAKNRVEGRVSLPLNRIKFWEGKKRYLNGTAELEVFTHNLGVDARVADVKVPGREVAEGFISGMGAWTWLAPYQKMEVIGPVLSAIKKATVTEDELLLETQP